MYCKYCGTKISDDARFCHSCGKELEIKQAQTETAETVTGTVDPNQYYNAYSQPGDNFQPLETPEVSELKDKIFSNGILSAVFANLPIPFLGIAGIVFGKKTGKMVKKLKDMGYRLRNKTKVGEILGKVGFILSIVTTAFWIFYFSFLVLMLLIAIFINSGGFDF